MGGRGTGGTGRGSWVGVRDGIRKRLQPPRFRPESPPALLKLLMPMASPQAYDRRSRAVREGEIEEGEEWTENRRLRR